MRKIQLRGPCGKIGKKNGVVSFATICSTFPPEIFTAGRFLGAQAWTVLRGLLAAGTMQSSKALFPKG
jgi:hypothetical protein